MQPIKKLVTVGLGTRIVSIIRTINPPTVIATIHKIRCHQRRRGNRPLIRIKTIMLTMSKTIPRSRAIPPVSALVLKVVTVTRRPNAAMRAPMK